MFPHLTLRWLHIEMTWLWVILSIMIFLWVSMIWSRRYRLRFRTLFFNLPLMMTITYLSGSYIMFILENKQFIPTTIRQLAQILIPTDYRFHAWWLMIGLIISIGIFVYQFSTKSMKKKWIDITFLGSMAGISILGVFLVLWDHMIGIPTISNRWITTLTPYSEVAKFNKVYPIGLWVSWVAIIATIIATTLGKKITTIWRGILWRSIFMILLGFVLIRQYYPRYGTMLIGDRLIDTNQYILWSSWILLLLGYLRWISSYYKHIIRMWQVSHTEDNSIHS